MRSTPIPSRAAVVTLLLAFLATLVPLQPAAAQGVFASYDGWVETTPTTIRPGGTPRIDVEVEPWDEPGEAFFVDGATVEILDGDTGDPVGSPPLTVQDGWRASFVPPADLVAGWYQLHLASGGATLDGHLVVEAPQPGAESWLLFEEMLAGATSVAFTADPAWLTDDVTVTEVLRYDPQTDGYEDVADTTTFERTDDARGTITLGAPLEPGDDLDVTLGNGEVTFTGWGYVAYPDVYLDNYELLEGATTGEVLRLQASGFTFDGGETVRLRSYGVPIPRGALGTPTLVSPQELAVEVLEELALGDYELVVTTAHGQYQTYLQVSEAGVSLGSSRSLIRSETPDSYLDEVYLSGLGQGWDETTTVELVDEAGVTAAVGDIAWFHSWSPARQELAARFDLTGVADGIHRVEVTTGTAVDDSTVVRVRGPLPQAYAYGQLAGDDVEVYPSGFAFEAGASVTLADRDGVVVGTTQVVAAEESFVLVELTADLADVVHTVTVEQTSGTYTGRFRPEDWYQDNLEVTPQQSLAGSSPDQFELRDVGGDLSPTVISETTGWIGGARRQIDGDLPERIDRERATQRYPGGLPDGFYDLWLDDDGVYSYGWMDVGDGWQGPRLTAEPEWWPSGAFPGDLRLRAEGFTLDTASDITARLFSYDWDTGDDIEVDGVGAATVVNADTLDIAITADLADGYYGLEVDIDGARYWASFDVGDGGGGRWLYADPYDIPAGGQLVTAFADGFTIAEGADLSAVLYDGNGALVEDAVGAVTRVDEGSLTIELSRVLPDDFYEAWVTIDGQSYWLDFMIGDGPPYAWVDPHQIVPDAATTVVINGDRTEWAMGSTSVELVHAVDGTTAGFTDDIAVSTSGASAAGDPGAPVPGAIVEFRVTSPSRIEVDLAALPEAEYEFVVTTGDQEIRAWLSVRVPTSVTVTPSVVDPRTLPRDLAVETLNLDLTDADVTLYGPGWEPITGAFTVTGPSTGTISLPADAARGYYELEVSADGRWAWTSFRIVETSVSISPALISDARSQGRVLAVTARGFDLVDPTVTLTDASDDQVTISTTPRWWERLDVAIGETLAPGRYTLTVAEGATTASTTLEVVAAPPEGETATPLATVGAGTPGTTTSDPETGLMTTTVGAFELEDVTVSFPIPGCPPGDDIVEVEVLFNGQPVETDWDTGACTGTATIPAELIRGDGGGTISVQVWRESGSTTSVIGEIVLYDPAGIVTDAVTGDPIEGAVTTLYRADGLTPAAGPTTESGECESSASVAQDPETGKNLWNQPITLEQGAIEPGDSPYIEPRPAALRQVESSKNPLVTTEAGYYGWDVAEGCWFVHVVADGYDSVVSPVVGIGPPPLEEVTDLDIAMTPTTVTPPPDETPPAWPDGAALTESGVTTNQVVLSWPAATDPSGPVQYQVQKDGAAVTGWITDLTATVSGLSADTSYSFAVFARDSADNVTATPLQRVVRTLAPPDTTPPVFGSGSLVASKVTANSLTLTWPTAVDADSPPVTYTVRRGTQILATGLSTTSYAVTGLSADTGYTFSVTATDAATNTSAPLSTTVRTAKAATPPPPTGPKPPTCADAKPGLSFVDVDPTSTHGGNIVCSAGLNLVTGKGDGTYDPGGSLTRGQTATILLRSLETSGVTLTREKSFSDVPSDHPHGTAIRKLAAAGIINGTSPSTFDPGGSVTRAQFAALLDRTSTEILAAYPEAKNPFVDVSGVHAPAITRLAGAGIIKGISPTTYGPGQDINRAQAASLFVRWLEDQAVRLR